jgi:hypothetical protein
MMADVKNSPVLDGYMCQRNWCRKVFSGKKGGHHKVNSDLLSGRH